MDSANRAGTTATLNLLPSSEISRNASKIENPFEGEAIQKGAKDGDEEDIHSHDLSEEEEKVEL